MDATTDLTKLKVADLKKELKIRGLATTGKRTELLDRLKDALAAGIGLEDGADDDEEFDEDEILAGEDGDDDALTPMEEAEALAKAEKVTATPARASRRSIAPAAATPATPRTAGRRLNIKRADPANLKVPEDEPEVVKKAPIASPAKSQVLTKSPAAKKTPASEPSADQPPSKVAKTTEGEDATANKENGLPEKEKSALEKRMERFGIVSEETMKEKRVERFGVVEKSGKKGKMASEPVDVEKLKTRAERFGETVAKTLTKAEVEEKKKTRAERFGEAKSNGVKKDVTSEEALAKRAAKFATTEPEKAEEKEVEPVFSASGKKLIVIGAEDAMKQKRMARFAKVS